MSLCMFECLCVSKVNDDVLESRLKNGTLTDVNRHIFRLDGQFPHVSKHYHWTDNYYNASRYFSDLI